jgi:NAD-dependent DNA ligase
MTAVSQDQAADRYGPHIPPEQLCSLGSQHRKLRHRLRAQQISARVAGIIVPVAQLEPVRIAGVSIQRASLHNTAHVASLDLRIGDAVMIERRGDVIPQVRNVIVERRPPAAQPWTPPSACPACGATLELRTQQAGQAAPNAANSGMQAGAGESTKARKSSGVDMLMCVNHTCSGRHGRLLEHFAETCIKGVGPSVVADFAKHGLLSSPVDFYSLKDRREQVRRRPDCKHLRLRLCDQMACLPSYTCSATRT